MYRARALNLIVASFAFGGTCAHAATTAEEPIVAGPVVETQAAIAVATAVSSLEQDREDSASMAPDDAASGEGSGWEVSITPYIWAAGMSGDIALPRFGQSVSVDRSFSDTLEDLDFAFMATVAARRNRFIMIGDIMYLDMSARANNIAGTTFLSGDVDTSILIGTAAVGYRVVDEGPAYVDVLAGARLVSLDVEVGLAAPIGSFRGGADPSDVSFMLGVRSRVPLSERLALGVYGDFGSFIEDSDVKWQLLGTLQYSISNRWTAVAGYRHLSIDHESTNLVFDVDLSGPLLGISYRF